MAVILVLCRLVATAKSQSSLLHCLDCCWPRQHAAQTAVGGRCMDLVGFEVVRQSRASQCRVSLKSVKGVSQRWSAPKNVPRKTVNSGLVAQRAHLLAFGGKKARLHGQRHREK
jgi:hypothetical protein